MESLIFTCMAPILISICAAITAVCGLYKFINIAMGYNFIYCCKNATIIIQPNIMFFVFSIFSSNLVV